MPSVTDDRSYSRGFADALKLVHKLLRPQQSVLDVLRAVQLVLRLRAPRQAPENVRTAGWRTVLLPAEPPAPTIATPLSEAPIDD